MDRFRERQMFLGKSTEHIHCGCGAGGPTELLRGWMRGQCGGCRRLPANRRKLVYIYCTRLQWNLVAPYHKIGRWDYKQSARPLSKEIRCQLKDFRSRPRLWEGGEINNDYGCRCLYIYLQWIYYFRHDWPFLSSRHVTGDSFFVRAYQLRPICCLERQGLAYSGICHHASTCCVSQYP